MSIVLIDFDHRIEKTYGIQSFFVYYLLTNCDRHAIMNLQVIIIKKFAKK